MFVIVYSKNMIVNLIENSFTARLTIIQVKRVRIFVLISENSVVGSKK